MRWSRSGMSTKGAQLRKGISSQAVIWSSSLAKALTLRFDLLVVSLDVGHEPRIDGIQEGVGGGTVRDTHVAGVSQVDFEAGFRSAVPAPVAVRPHRRGFES